VRKAPPPLQEKEAKLSTEKEANLSTATLTKKKPSPSRHANLTITTARPPHGRERERSLHQKMKAWRIEDGVCRKARSEERRRNSSGEEELKGERGKGK